MIERLEIRKGAPSGCGKDFSSKHLTNICMAFSNLSCVHWLNGKIIVMPYDEKQTTFDFPHIEFYL
jgi:hypothetical protein